MGPVAGGTTDDMMAAVTSCRATPSSSHRARSRAAYSSALRSTRVSARQSVRRASPLNRPNTVCVFPMSTASSMKGAFYIQTMAVALLAASFTPGCKKREVKLTTIAENLDRDLGEKPMPNLTEPEKLADRLSKWDDFRSCTVRTFVARKREADRLKREGQERPRRHATIGEAAVEECAVESAIVKKDRGMCQRLAADYEGPSGEVPLAAIRCWDTWAKVFGSPEDCPVIWLPDDLPGRNPECLALAHRDSSFCPFAEDPGRCRALLLGEPASCQGAAPDCRLAVEYWSGLIPLQMEKPVIDVTPVREGEKALFAQVDVRRANDPTLRID